MEEAELKYFFPYRIGKQYHFKDKLQNREALFDDMEGKSEYFYKDEGNYGYRRNRSHLSLLECSINDYTVYDLFLNWERWFKSGRNIFSFSYELLEMLKDTDVDDVTYKSFSLPYDSFYLSLRPLNLKITNDSDKIIEGVYVNVNRMAMEKDIDYKGNEFWGDYAIEFHFVGDFEDLIKIWNDHGSRGHNFLSFAFYFSEKENIVIISDAVKYWQSIEVHFLFPENKKEITDDHLDLFGHYRELVNNAYKIIVNCSLYLSMCKEDKDIEIQYTEDLPFSFNKKLGFSKNKREKEKIERKIVETGFSRIYYVGTSFKKQVNMRDDTNIILSPHWRRGHWRNQRFGEGLLSKKLLWIKPVIVNKSLGIPQKGHICNISD